MKICIPVNENNGLESKPYNHFGSAPMFLIFDSESNQLKDVQNGDLNHEHGMCQPIKAISGEVVDAVLVGGIGKGAISKLNSMGIKVFRAIDASVKDNVDALLNSKLDEIESSHGCDHHGCNH